MLDIAKSYDVAPTSWRPSGGDGRLDLATDLGRWLLPAVVVDVQEGLIERFE